MFTDVRLKIANYFRIPLVERGGKVPEACVLDIAYTSELSVLGLDLVREYRYFLASN